MERERRRCSAGIMKSPLPLDTDKKAVPARITSVRFSRYKAFREFSLTLERFNILVGPSNSVSELSQYSDPLSTMRLFTRKRPQERLCSPIELREISGISGITIPTLLTIFVLRSKLRGREWTSRNQ